MTEDFTDVAIDYFGNLNSLMTDISLVMGKRRLTILESQQVMTMGNEIHRMLGNIWVGLQPPPPPPQEPCDHAPANEDAP